MGDYAIKNHVGNASVFYWLGNHRQELRSCLIRCKVDGAISPHNIKFELVRQLGHGMIYNVSDDDLMDYLRRVYPRLVPPYK